MNDLLRALVEYCWVGGRGAPVTIRDHEGGVPEGALQAILETFYRVEAERNRSSGGVGLGHAIARRTVEPHAGVISANNTDPDLCVTVSLPLALCTPR